MKNPLRLTGVATILAALAACSNIPNTGPRASDLREAASAQAEAGTAPDFRLAEIDRAAIEALERMRVERQGALVSGPSSRGRRLRVGGPGRGHDLGGRERRPLLLDRAPAVRSRSACRASASAATAASRSPYAGRIRVEGREPRAASAMVRTALQGKAVEPQALLVVQSSPGSIATVLGDATNGGGVVPLRGAGERLLDVIASAGGLKTPPHRTKVRLTRGAQVGEAHLSRVLREPAQNVPVRPGDVINLLESPQTITVFGAASLPSRVDFTQEEMMLDEALAQAGGLDDRRADPGAVFVFRYEDPDTAAAVLEKPAGEAVEPMVYNLNLRDPAAFFLARRFAMEDRDIIYVANAPIANFEKVLRVIGLSLQPATTAISLANLF